MAGERTEAPTPKRRDDARKKGQVSKSQELVSTGVLLVAVFTMRQLGPDLWANMATIVRDGLSQDATRELTPESSMALGQASALALLKTLAPLFAALGIAGIVFNVGQSGLYLNTAGIKPKMQSLNVAANAKRLVGTEGAIGLAKSVAKMSVAAIVVYMAMRSQLSSIAAMSELSVAAAGARLGTLAFDIAIRGAVALFVLSLADYAWQRRKFMSNLRMTKEEVRQEMKESDGDPQVKAAIRRRRQQLMNRMMSAVPTADVIVTNPTHYAVALKYDPVSMGAPMVVAKGENLLAQRIKELGRKAGVPVLEEPPLARALYAAVPVGQYVPANLFHAVAEVLAWVYSLRQRTGGRRPSTNPQGAI